MYLLHPKVKLLEIPKKVGEDYLTQLMPERAKKSASRIRMSQPSKKSVKSEIMKS
jgi:hypothetical protein